jgi:hypothetical protein
MTKQISSEVKKTWTHRADNRERLIAAGYTILSEKGYEATTVEVDLTGAYDLEFTMLLGGGPAIP